VHGDDKFIEVPLGTVNWPEKPSESITKMVKNKFYLAVKGFR
jgi:hypothetical protein